MPLADLGWRRLWPFKFWMYTRRLESGCWTWEIWSWDRTIKLAMGAEDYRRQADAARGGVRFGASERTVLTRIQQSAEAQS